MRFRFRSLLRNLLGKKEAEKDIDAEVRAFAQMLADERIADGASQAEAERLALAECGGIEPLKQRVRDSRSGVGLETFWQDLRFGVRQLRRNPVFAVAAILTLGVGIGANTAIFSFVNSVLLRPLPYPDADRLTMILSEFGNSSRAPASMFELYQMRQRSREFEQIAGIWVTNRVLPGKGDPEQGKVGVVTANFLPLFCVRLRGGVSSDRKTTSKMRRPRWFSRTSCGYANSAAIQGSLAHLCRSGAGRRSSSGCFRRTSG